MTKADEARAFALSRVGCPYIYGGTGQFCTPAYREARAAQYPKYAGKIAANCPRLSGKDSSCALCRWWDESAKQGKRAYDCAQLARAVMKAAGVELLSGANTQWQKTPWARRGSIDTLPERRLALLYRNDGTRMGHTGVSLGDGTLVHAKGHDFGVVRESLGGPAFTHWGIPAGLYEAAQLPPEDPLDAACASPLKKGDAGRAVSALQMLLNIASGAGLTVDGKYGDKTDAAAQAFLQDKHAGSTAGAWPAHAWALLRRAAGGETPAAAASAADDDGFSLGASLTAEDDEAVQITLPWQQIAAWQATLRSIADALGALIGR